MGVHSLRLERLIAIQGKFRAFSEGQSVLSTVHIMPIIDHLYRTVIQLEVALEAEPEVRRCIEYLSSPSRRDQPLHPHEQLLMDELEAVRELKRRCDEVKRDNE